MLVCDMDTLQIKSVSDVGRSKSHDSKLHTSLFATKKCWEALGGGGEREIEET